MVHEHGTKLEDPSKIADCLNKHFSSVGEKMASKFDNSSGSDLKNPLDYITENNRNSMYLTNVDASEICRLILNLDVKKSCGYDQISNRVLKETCHVITPFLEIFFNKCLKTGVFPDCFKIAKVIALYKGGEKHSCDSYRPISLLPR